MSIYFLPKLFEDIDLAEAKLLQIGAPPELRCRIRMEWRLGTTLTVMDDLKGSVVCTLADYSTSRSPWTGRHLLRQIQFIFDRRIQSIEPLSSVDYLFNLFLDQRNCDALVGDLKERYKLIHKTFGAGRANFWYWTQAIRSVGPIAWAWGRKVVMKPVIGLIAWAVAKRLVDNDSWLAALVEIWKRIRS